MEFAAPILFQSFTPADDFTEPVTVQEVKDWLMIDHTDWDLQIPRWITAARRNIERWCGGISLISGSGLFKTNLSRQSPDVEVIKFPYVLDMGMVDGVVVNYLVDGEADVEQMIDDDYYLDSSLRIVNNGTYEVAFDLTITEVPEDLKQAILILIAYRRGSRGDQDTQLGIPNDVQLAISPYAIPCL